eukprot:235667_1
MLASSTKLEQSVPLISSSKQAIAGFTAGFTSTLLTYPLDLVKTRLQSSHFQSYNKSTFLAFRSIITQHGINGLFVGIGASLFGSTTAWGTYFYLYSKIKDSVRVTPNAKLKPRQHLTSAFIAGSMTQILSTPIWVIKTNLQLSAKGQFVDCVHEIYSSRGLRGFWRGVIPSMFGVCQSSIHFMVYERLKYIFQDRSQSYMTPIEIIMSTIVAKSTALVVTYPYQIVRTRLQHINGGSGSETITDIFNTIWRANRIRGFYAGMHLNIIRIMPSTCITFLIYESA